MNRSKRDPVRIERSVDQPLQLRGRRKWRKTDSFHREALRTSIDLEITQLAEEFPDVLDQWRHSAHETFRTRSLWSLFNAFTEVHKTGNPHTSLRRGEALHGLFDAAADLPLVA